MCALLATVLTIMSLVLLMLMLLVSVVLLLAGLLFPSVHFESCIINAGNSRI